MTVFDEGAIFLGLVSDVGSNSYVIDFKDTPVYATPPSKNRAQIRLH